MGKGSLQSLFYEGTNPIHRISGRDKYFQHIRSEELWTEVHNIVQETVFKTIPKKKKCKKAKWLSEEALQTAEKRREAKGKGEMERYTHLNAEFQGIARRNKKAYLSDQCKEIEENNRMGKTRDLIRKIRDTKGTFHANMGIIKDRNSMDLTEATTPVLLPGKSHRQRSMVGYSPWGRKDSDTTD